MRYPSQPLFSTSFQRADDAAQLVSADTRQRTLEADAAMALDDWEDYYPQPVAPAPAAAAPGQKLLAPALVLLP
ncbi:hypothetical protein [Hymenobacter convexus]|uniref:hypothetical protein n=1 Tax=Hymenobacter sp. CA1UV-4 TaxID=3063782 RepID=UPI002713B7DB|nr:hypothetical protein [Hymenobacter sp. CA1UV-4]MDO7852445.1 hypothetical protein [Hymenobacter sp. CA1UV-4]